jgi:hypothetical protein
VVVWWSGRAGRAGGRGGQQVGVRSGGQVRRGGGRGEGGRPETETAIESEVKLAWDRVGGLVLGLRWDWYWSWD